MSGLLGRARRLLKSRSAPSVPTPFATRCLCGERIDGLRRPDYQLLTCPGCGNSVFILPQSPLAPVEKPAASGLAGKAASPLASPRPRAESTPVVAKERIPLSESVGRFLGAFIPPRSWFSTPRLILGAVCLMVVLTTTWQVRQSRRKAMRESVVPDSRRALQLLADGELDDARALLAKSIASLDALGERFPDEAHYRQAYAELLVLDDLLEDRLDEALDDCGSSPEIFARRLSGRYIVLDAVVAPEPGGGYSVSFTPFMQGKPVRIDACGLTLFERLHVTSRARLVFAAKLGELTAGVDGDWTITFQPESGVLISQPRVFDALKLSKDGDASELIRNQQQRLQAGQSEQGE